MQRKQIDQCSRRSRWPAQNKSAGSAGSDFAKAPSDRSAGNKNATGLGELLKITGIS